MAIIRLEGNSIRETSQEIDAAMNGGVTRRPLYSNKIAIIACVPVCVDRDARSRKSAALRILSGIVHVLPA
jgi:hypothetical protein